VQKSKINSVALTQKQKVYSNDPDYALIRELIQKGIAPPKATPKPSSTSTSTPTKTKTPTTSSTDSYETC
jgi:hypothetical protein